jgi:hypothetical protein
VEPRAGLDAVAQKKNLFPLPGLESLLLFDTNTNFIYINKRENEMEILKTQDPKT